MLQKVQQYCNRKSQLSDYQFNIVSTDEIVQQRLQKKLQTEKDLLLGKKTQKQIDVKNQLIGQYLMQIEDVYGRYLQELKREDAYWKNRVSQLRIGRNKTLQAILTQYENCKQQYNEWIELNKPSYQENESELSYQPECIPENNTEQQSQTKYIGISDNDKQRLIQLMSTQNQSDDGDIYTKKLFLECNTKTNNIT